MSEITGQSILWMYYDKILKLFLGETFNGILMNSSKNDLLILIYLFRFNDATVTELAEHISSPPNTVTGIVTRLEKRSLITRIRQTDDRRVVKISLTEQGKHEVEQSVATLSGYLDAIESALTPDEITTLFGIADKVITALGNSKKPSAKRIKRITIE